MLIGAYRDKNSVSDYTLAGLLTGSLFKTYLGIKGIISGGVFGAIIGTFGGAIFLGGLKLAGMSVKEYADMQTYYIYARDRAVHYSQLVSKYELKFG